MTPAEAEAHSAMQSERRHLGSLAYRLLATLTDVEAAVQAAYIQWYRLTAEERDVIEDPSCTMTSP